MKGQWQVITGFRELPRTISGSNRVECYLGCGHTKSYKNSEFARREGIGSKVLCSSCPSLMPIRDRCPKGKGESIFLRLMSQDTDDCIEWPYWRTMWGYGTVWFGGSQEATHRLAFAMTNGSIPEDMNVLHKCDNPPCFNPRHLFLGTGQDNQTDMQNKDRSMFGIKNSMAKLDDNKVRRIRHLYQKGVRGFGKEALAHMFGVSPAAIVKVVRRKTWQRVI
jgi:HNH endonuclease